MPKYVVIEQTDSFPAHLHASYTKKGWARRLAKEIVNEYLEAGGKADADGDSWMINWSLRDGTPVTTNIQIVEV